jgi:hypothetical protein
MLAITLAWLTFSRQKIHSKQKVKNKNFIVIIPVLREQKILKKTLTYFLSMNYDLAKLDIILVSTEKEIKDVGVKSLNKKTTIDLIDKLKKEINKKYNRQIITHLHYPLVDGKMVHQVNYSFDYILKKYKKDFGDIFVALYNADSRPDLNTFSTISFLAKDRSRRVFQQSALFFDNFFDFKSKNNFFTKKYLMANAVLHSRWTLAHEIPRLLRQSFFINHFKKRFFLSHCVGHGLFLRLDFLKKIKAMPTITMTEDLFFGYILSSLGEAINPVPVLEKAEAPATFMSALKQKYVWFFGPMDHLSYENFFKDKFPNYSSLLILKWFSFQGILPALAWLFMAWLFLFSFLYPLMIYDYELFLGVLILFFFYGPLSYVLVLFTNKKIDKSFRIKHRDYFWLILFSFPAIFLHSMPPIVSLVAKINYLFTKKEPNKPKTER